MNEEINPIVDFTDPGNLRFKQHFFLEKFDGEKVPGDGKMPVETLEGGDGEDTIHTDVRTGIKTIVKTAEEKQNESIDRRRT